MAFQLNNVVPWGRNMDAMKLFLNDFEAGLSEGRYRYHELPNCLSVEENYYDIGLSSQFLLLYT